VQLRYDLVDTNVYICTPEVSTNAFLSSGIEIRGLIISTLLSFMQVPMMFTDNFDYRGVQDFIRGVLQADEVRLRLL